MKKLVLMAVMICFGLSDSMAQNVKTVNCKKPQHKVVKHKKVTKKKTTTKVAVVSSPVMCPIPEPSACYSYRRNNIYVTECPNLMFDQCDRIQMSLSGSYSGYRPNLEVINQIPGERLQFQCVPPPSNEYRGVAPQSGNFFGGNCNNCR